MFSLKFVPKGPINNYPSLVQIMAWRRSGDKPLSEPMMVSLLTHICVTRPQWVIVVYKLCQRFVSASVIIISNTKPSLLIYSRLKIHLWISPIYWNTLVFFRISQRLDHYWQMAYEHRCCWYKEAGQFGWVPKTGALCIIRYPSKMQLNIKSAWYQISLAYNLFCSCPIVLKSYTEHDSVIAVVCKFSKRFDNWNVCYGRTRFRQIWV